MKNFDFKETDEEGLQTLETIADAHAFNKWMYETVAPHTRPGNMLEIGSGIGNISHFFLEDGREMVLSDLRLLYCQFLQRKFGKHPCCRNILQLDLVHPDFDQQYSSLLGSFDNAYALNVVEHIANDGQAILNASKLLRPGGRLIILVPAWPCLYNAFDEELHHYRRYTASSLAALIQTAPLGLLRCFYFNFMGIPAWYISGKLMKNRVIPGSQMKLYNALVPVFKRIDPLLGRKAGLSVVAVAQKLP
ncbi:MAG: class I SAM-dependent methyltransferase, partial [Bacteroidetes bacterium]